jgi:hypothetical protein
MKIFPYIFQELRRPDDQGVDWYGWSTNQMTHFALGIVGAFFFNIVVVMIFAIGKEVLDLNKGGKIMDSVVDVLFWGTGAFFLTAPGFVVICLIIMLFFGVVKRFKRQEPK